MIKYTLLVSLCISITSCNSLKRNSSNLDNIIISGDQIYTVKSDKNENNLYFAGRRFIKALITATNHKKPNLFPQLPNEIVILLKNKKIIENLDLNSKELKLVENNITGAKSKPEELIKLYAHKVSIETEITQLNTQKNQVEAQRKRLKNFKDIVDSNLTTIQVYKIAEVFGADSSTTNYTAKYQELHEFLDSGISYSRMLCSAYFEIASRSQSSREFLGEGIDLLGGFTAAVQGVTGVEAKIISLTASIFSLSKSGLGAWEKNIGLTPDVQLLYSVATLKQNAEEKNIFTALTENFGDSNSINTYYQAERALLKYADICTVKGLKKIVDESLNAARKDAKGK